MKDLAGKTAFVTGAASGIGLGIATALAHYGLTAMAAVMGTSDLLAPHLLLRRPPDCSWNHLGLQWLSKGVLFELFRFAGSYQLVSVLDVVYNSLIPVAILKCLARIQRAFMPS